MLFSCVNLICCSLEPINPVKDGGPLAPRYRDSQGISFLSSMLGTGFTTDIYIYVYIFIHIYTTLSFSTKEIVFLTPDHFLFFVIVCDWHTHVAHCRMANTKSVARHATSSPFSCHKAAEHL